MDEVYDSRAILNNIQQGVVINNSGIAVPLGENKAVGCRNTATPADFFDGDIGFTYFTTDYIDFSKEANRNLFVNQLGYPRDLQPLIDEGTIPNPLIYLDFADPDNLGNNKGTGGDFTINGTVTSGSDFTTT